jgi:hypothetical protein
MAIVNEAKAYWLLKAITFLLLLGAVFVVMKLMLEACPSLPFRCDHVFQHVCCQ